MAGPLDNILHAYVAASADRHAREAEQLQREQLQESHDFHQKQLDQVYKVHKEANDLQQKTMDIHKSLVGMQMTNMLNEHLGTPDQAPPESQNIQSQGPQVQPGTATMESPTATTAPQLNTGAPSPWNYKPPGSEEAFPQGFQIDPGYVAREAKNKADAYEQMNKPFLDRYTAEQDAQQQRALAVDEQKATENFQRMQELERLRGVNDQNTARVHGSYVLSAAKIRAAAMSGGEDGGLDPSLLQQYATWKQDPLSLPSKFRTPYLKAMADAGLTPPNKEGQTVVGNLAQIDPLIDQLKDFAAKYSRDGSQSTLLGNARILGNHPIPGTDAAKAMDNIRSQGGALTTMFDQNKRKSEQEIVRTLVGAGIDTRATVAQNMDNINNHIKTANGIIRGHLKMDPHQLNAILGEAGIHNFGQMEGGDTVKLQAPDGSIKEVSKDQVNHFVKLGAKVVQ